MVKQRSNSTKDIESDMQGYCLGMKNKYRFFFNWSKNIITFKKYNYRQFIIWFLYFVDIYHLSAICTLPVVVAIIIIFTASRLWKRYRNGKNTAFGADNHLDQCCWYVYEAPNNFLRICALYWI